MQRIQFVSRRRLKTKGYGYIITIETSDSRDAQESACHHTRYILIRAK